MAFVKKRDGRIVEWDISKIVIAIEKSFGALKKEITSDVYTKIVDIAENLFPYSPEQNPEECYSVEDIQDAIVASLIRNGYVDVALEFTKYRERRSIARNSNIDALELINDYLDANSPKHDMAVHENASTTFSLQGMHQYIFESVIQRKWFSLLNDDAQRAHEKGLMHIHDLGYLGPYCCGWDLKQLLEEGFNGVDDKLYCSPAKHFGSALGQAVNFIYTLQGESAGAQAFSNFNTLLAPFVALDELTYKQVRQTVQDFIYNLNISTRVGFQAPFSNITLDLDVTKTKIAEDLIIVGGVMDGQGRKYKDFQKEAQWINQAIVEIMEEGDGRGSPFTYPIITFNVTKDFPWESKFGETLLKATAKYGNFYWANYINSDFAESDVTSMCLSGDTIVRVQNKQTGKRDKCTLEDLIDNRGVENYLIKTPKRYKPILRPIKVEGETTAVKVVYESGKSLILSENHPHLIKTDEKTYEIVMGKDLKVGMISSVLPDKWIPLLNHSEAIISVEMIPWNEPLYDIEIEQVGKNDTHYFYANDILTHNCCRLRIDRKAIAEYVDSVGGLDDEDYDKTHQKGHGFFGAAPNTGSIGVVTLNLPALMDKVLGERPYVVGNNDINNEAWIEYKNMVKEYMNIAAESLLLKRKQIERYCDLGLYPYIKHYLRHVKARTGNYFSQHFSTICTNGFHEAMIVWGFEDGMNDGRSWILAEDLLKMMNEYTVVLQRKYNVLFNLEQAPAESAGVKLCQKSGIDPLDNGYYTNSTWFPADSNVDLFNQIKVQSRLNEYYTGGSAMHIYTDVDLLPIYKEVKKLVMYTLSETRIPYITVSPTYSVCPTHGRIAGIIEKCPKCSMKMTSYARITGYYRSLENFNKGRKKEAFKRKYFRFNNISDLSQNNK